MNRHQEWVLRVGGLLLAGIAYSYGVDFEDSVWQYAVPICIVVGLVWVALRSTSAPLPGGFEQAQNSSSAKLSILDDLEHLTRLHRKGVLADAEFTLAKERLLGKSMVRGPGKLDGGER